MDLSVQLLLFIISIATLFTDIQTQTKSKWNWFEAQEHCRDKGGLTAKKNISSLPYWTEKYVRLSPWIKIIGCYPNSVISKQKNTCSKIMKRKSVGICQEICNQVNTTRFAVQLYNCICFKDELQISNEFEALSTNCNQSCHTLNKVYKTECGSAFAHNVFEFEPGGIIEFDNNKTCLSLQCSYGYKTYSLYSCSSSLNNLCKQSSFFTHGNAASWVESMKNCEPGYLFGNVDLRVPSQYCNLSTDNIDVHWIGVARQMYKSEDQGWKIKKEERKTFMQCKVCKGMQCSFKSCFDTLNDTPTCKSPELLPVTSTTNDYMYMDTTNEDFCQVISTNRTQEKKVDEQNSSTLHISISVVGGLAMLLIVAAGMFMYFRRKNNKNNDSGAEKPHELTVAKPAKVDQQQDSYFVLDKCSQEMPKESESKAENPYTDSRDGIYDHLRDNNSRKKAIEDTYQRTPAAAPGDMSDYDTTANAVNNLEQDSTYDHAHQNINRNSDYGYNLQANKNSIENSYDIANGKNYK